MATDDNHSNFAAFAPALHESSPLKPHHFLKLLFQPRQFFSGRFGLSAKPYVLLVAWVYGMHHVMEGLNRQLLRFETGLSESRELIELIAPWPLFWLVVGAMGAIAAVVAWQVGGWWYCLRLRWSGAINPEPRLARLIFMYSGFIYTSSNLAFVLWQTFRQSDYIYAFEDENKLAFLFLIFPFWAMISGYHGIRANFKVSRWKARFWFIALPCALYLINFAWLVLQLLLWGTDSAS
ncbi:MAG: hypothetical protein AAGG51_28755 [Cyanobacteria bacterium P01_G01_bin.54]